MAWAKRRQPIRTYDSTSMAWKGRMGIVEVSEYSCPLCGSEKIRLIIVRWKGRVPDDRKYVPNSPVPPDAELYPPRNRSIGLKCEKCGFVSTGSTSLTTDIARRDLNARQKVRVS